MKIATLCGVLLCLLACKEKSNKNVIRNVKTIANYNLEENAGIFTEVFDSTNTNANRYTENNLIYKEGSSFTFSYEHYTIEGDKLYFKEDLTVLDREHQWEFVRPDSEDRDIIKKVRITVKYGLEPMIRIAPDYNQTLLEYDYPTEDNKLPFNSISGCIENENNVWIHPPRDRYFRILELNPFPFIKAPYKVGNSWEWWLNIGSQWGDERWKTWEGGIENQYFYEITDKSIFDTVFGSLECYEIESVGTSELGETKLTAFFNEKYGFIELNYVNIDGSKTNLKLIEFSEKRID